MKSFSDIIKNRQSVRRFSTKIVERELILACIEAARIAPSACNSQPWKFIIVDDPEIVIQTAECTFDNIIRFNRFTKQAPAFVIITLEKAKLIAQIGSKVKNIQYSLIDIGIAAEHFCLQAAELGIGTCMLGWFHEQKLKALFHIPENRSIGLVIALGFPPEGYPLRKKQRKSLNEITGLNKY